MARNSHNYNLYTYRLEQKTYYRTKLESHNSMLYDVEGAPLIVSFEYSYIQFRCAGHAPDWTMIAYGCRINYEYMYNIIEIHCSVIGHWRALCACLLLYIVKYTAALALLSSLLLTCHCAIPVFLILIAHSSTVIHHAVNKIINYYTLTFILLATYMPSFQYTSHSLSYMYLISLLSLLTYMHTMEYMIYVMHHNI